MSKEVAEEKKEVVDDGSIYEPEGEDYEGVELPDDFDPDFLAELAKDDEESPDTDEEEAGDEDKGEDEGEEDKGDDKGKMIPKKRLDEATRKERAKTADVERQLAEAKAEIEALRAGQYGPVDTSDIDAEIKTLRKQIRELDIDDNYDDKVDALEDKIEALRDRKFQLKASQAAQATNAVENEKAAIDRVVKAMYAEMPEIDPKSEFVDQKKAKTAVALYNNYLDEGKTPLEALKEVRTDMIEMFGLGVEKEEPVQLGEQVAKVRQHKEEVKRVAAKSQPPTGRPTSAGAATRVDITKLSPQELMRIPESVRAKARGDIL